MTGRRVEYESDLSFAGVGQRSLRVVSMPDRDVDGTVIGWIASILDVTDEKQATDARALVSSIVGTSYDTIVTKDLSGRITSWNPAVDVVSPAADAKGVRMETVLDPRAAPVSAL